MNKVFIFLVLMLFLFTPSAFAEERTFEIKAKKFSYTPNIVNGKEMWSEFVL